MPTRRLPRNNAERSAALNRAKERKDAPTTDPLQIPYTAATIGKLDTVQPDYKLKLAKVASALSLQTEITAVVTKARIMAAFFVADMLEAMQRAVRRELFLPSARAYYQLPVGEPTIPRMRTEAEVLEWGEKVIQGETDRIAAGGAPITFPDLAEVTVAFNDFRDKNLLQAERKGVYDTAQEAVQADNIEVDKLILKLWNETETFFDEGEKPAMRRKAREWGVVYVPSAGEVPTPEEYSLIGTVRLDDASGAPLSDVSLLIVELGVEVSTDNEGRFYFGIQPAGSYTVLARKAGFLDTELPGINIVDGELTELDITMRPEPMPPVDPEPPTP